MQLLKLDCAIRRYGIFPKRDLKLHPFQQRLHKKINDLGDQNWIRFAIFCRSDLKSTKKSLNERCSPINVDFCYLDLSIGENCPVWGLERLTKFIKCRTTDPMLWFGVLYRKKEYLGLISPKTKCARIDLQKTHSVQ